MKASSAKCLLAAVATWIVAAVSFAEETAAAPAITREQIQSDWLRQDELRGSPAGQARVANVTPAEDAAGGVDGIKNGNWGFHTENEENPFWQVDLQQVTPLDRLVLYNRCDSCAARNARIKVLLSSDGKQWAQVYQHHGQTFYGKTDDKPLVVPLGGQKARQVRLQLPGKSYFHLDEVEVYRTGGPENVALGKPATQSSVSQWSARHKADAPAVAAARSYPTAQAIERGLKLAEDLRRTGATIEPEETIIRQAAERLKQLPAEVPDAVQRGLYLQVRWAVRAMALKNPLLDFEAILFAKRIPPSFPHMSDQYYGWWSRGGGGLYLLEGFRTQQPRLRCLSGDWPQGSFLDPDISYDGKKVLFAYCRHYAHVAGIGDKVNKDNLPEDAFYKIFEMNLDGSGRRQLTFGKYDDFDARYLPSGEIVFLSTRKGQSIQVCRSSAAATTAANMPDSYVRCGGGNSRPVPVFTLHVIRGDGKDLRPISAFENFEWTPSVANDGRILYARWDYIDRFNGHFMSLWSTNPDGTNAQLVFKNFTTRPQCVFEARAIPNSQKLVFTAAAHHSNMGGSLALLDRTRGTEEQRPMTRLTPEVCFPESEGWPTHYYANPYPLSEDYFLVAWSDRGLPPHTYVTDDRNPVNPTGIYLYDGFGNLELLHRDPAIASSNPLPVRPRARPPVLPCTVAWDGPQEGTFLVQDVYQGLGGVARGTVKQLRIVGVPPKVQPHMNSPSLGVSKEDPGKFVLGSVPVEADGSAWFRVPSGIPVFFQALDAEGLAVQTMRSLTYVQAGQTLACIGCHESREAAPTTGRPPLAVLRGASRPRPGPAGSWPLRFDELVQPVLDKHCLSCHSPASKDAKAARFDLSPARAYQNLLAYADKDLEKLAFEKDRSIVGQCPAQNSKLLGLLRAEGGHEGVKLDADALNRLITWMDTYAQRLGHFSDEQEAQLRQLRQQWAPPPED